MKIHKQSGITLIGFIIVLAIALFASFIGMKIGPIYVDNFSVIRAMNEIADEPGSSRKSPYDIRLKFFTLMNINSIDHVRESHVKLIRGNGVNLRVTYEVREPIMGNLDVVVRFDKSVRLN
ncbi:DUF4845 domain-containing protein [Pseudomonadota bacterium]